MKPDELICSRHFRETVLNECPVLCKDPTLRRLFAYLVFGTWRCLHTNDLMIPAEVLAYLERLENRHQHNNYKGKDFLDRFSKHVAHIDYSESVWFVGRCRTVRRVDWSSNVQRAILQERAERQGQFTRSSSAREDRVFFTSGSRVTSYALRTQREALRQEAMRRIVDAGSSDAVRLLTYLSSQSSNRYTKMLANLDAALSAALHIQDERARDHAVDTLLAIREQPLPFYQASPKGRTVRIFPLTTSLLTLNSYVRRVLTPDWIDMDLRNAQCSIIAADWQIASLQNFLEQSLLEGAESLWKYLLKQLNIEEERHRLLKPALKDALYSTVFGATKRNICWHLTHDSSQNNLGRRFLAIPLMQDILLARQRRMSEIIKQGGAINIYGDWIPLPSEKAPQNGVRSVLAQVAQAAEMKLMAPVIDLALEQTGKKSGFDITLWQHDGFSFVADKKEDVKHWISRLQQAVGSQAKSLGYRTRLEVSEFDPESTLAALNSKIKKVNRNKYKSTKNMVNHQIEMPCSDSYVMR
ncbi:MAG: hypothetical protein QM758_00435 [Armatimonas sp.]